MAEKGVSTTVEQRACATCPCAFLPSRLQTGGSCTPPPLRWAGRTPREGLLTWPGKQVLAFGAFRLWLHGSPRA